MSAITERLSKWANHDWILPALLFLLVMLGTLGPGSYFLNFDTPTLSENAADLVLGGCWGPSGKPGVSLLLSVLFLLGGVNPLWDMVMLTLLGAITLVCFHALATHFTGSRRWALLGTLWFVSLPAILYYTRIHMGYPLAFFLMGMTFQTRKRYGWAGLAFGLAPIMHTNFLVPLATWLGASFLLHEREERFRDFIRLGAVFLIPILALEMTRALFMGQLFFWSRNVFDIVQRHGSHTYQTTWAHIPVLLVGTNGWPNALLLFAGIAYPAIRRRPISLLDAVYLAAWSVFVAYTLWVGVGHKELVQRMIVGIYPLMALLSLFTVMEIARRVDARLKAGARRLYRVAGGLVVAIILPASLIGHLLDANVGSRTAYPQIEETMIRAAEAGLPVRYFGNFHVGYFYALVHQVETSINETSLDLITGDTRAVMIFENTGRNVNPLLEALADDPRVDLADYEVTTFSPHLPSYRAAGFEGRAGTAEMMARIWTIPSPRSDDATMGSVTVWWPRQPEGAFQARHEPLAFVFHYTGGCITPRRFGEENYYHLLADKAVILWQELRAGHFREMVDLIVTWIRE
jgi:hypothetical protein